MNDWQATTERYIAFVDIMGFSNYVYRNSHYIVKKRMELIHSIIEDTEKEIFTLSQEVDKIDKPIKTVIFSDSILIITKDNSKNSLDYFFVCLSNVALRKL